jgi:hypothetical protein
METTSKRFEEYVSLMGFVRKGKALRVADAAMHF